MASATGTSGSASRDPRAAIWWRLFALAATLWAMVLPLAPFAASRPHGGALAFGFASAAYALGSVICHQLSARSFQLWTTPLPVCARCTGIYFGAALAAIVLPMDSGLKGARPDGATARLVCLVAVVPTAATLLYEWTTGEPPANWIRALAGAPIGAAVAWIIREVN